MASLIGGRTDNSVDGRLGERAGQELRAGAAPHQRSKRGSSGRVQESWTHLEAVAEVDDERVWAVADELPLAVVVIAELEACHRLRRDERERRRVAVAPQPVTLGLLLVVSAHAVVQHGTPESAARDLGPVLGDVEQRPDGTLGEFEDDVEKRRELADDVEVQVREVLGRLGEVPADEVGVRLLIAQGRVQEVTLLKKGGASAKRRGSA